MEWTLENILAISLSFTLLLLPGFFILTIVLRSQRLVSIEVAEQTTCGACSALQIDGSLPNGCKKEKDKNSKGGRCCCKSSSVIDTLVEKASRKYFAEFNQRETAAVINLEDCDPVKQTAGKVAGIAYHRLKEETREKNLVYWDKSEKSILESIRHTNGRFYISDPGFYYVFSQIMYAHDVESISNTNARQSHTLHRYSFKQGTLETLLENTRTFAELQFSQNNGTSFLGAVFEFDVYDEIMIHSTHTHKITGDERGNFFSLYKI